MLNDTLLKSSNYPDSSFSDIYHDSTDNPSSKEHDDSLHSFEFYNSDTSLASTYKYLDDNPLSKHFGDFTDTTKTYTLHICIFKVTLGYKHPFLQFLIDNKSSSFPCVENFKCQSIHEQSDCNTFFVNACFSEVIDLLNIHKIFNPEMSSSMYKGFVQQDDSNIFAVFECTEQIDFSSSEKLHWNILDDIVSPIVETFFMKQSFMTDLITDDGTALPRPFLLYLCQNDLLHNYPINEKERFMIDQTIEHNFLGDSYFFTSSPINNNGHLQRYAAFVDNAKYILKDIHYFSNSQKETFLKNNSLNDIITIYFHQNTVQYWCIKNSNNFTRI